MPYWPKCSLARLRHFLNKKKSSFCESAREKSVSIIFVFIIQEHKNLGAFVNKLTNAREMKTATLTVTGRPHFHYSKSMLVS